VPNEPQYDRLGKEMRMMIRKETETPEKEGKMGKSNTIRSEFKSVWPHIHLMSQD
jgi:hypothetical protein